MKPLLDFDDAGAADDEPAKGVTVGDIRAWHDELEAREDAYNRILTSWAECRKLLWKERAISARAESELERRRAHDMSKNNMPNPAMRKTAE